MGAPANGRSRGTYIVDPTRIFLPAAKSPEAMGRAELEAELLLLRQKLAALGRTVSGDVLQHRFTKGESAVFAALRNAKGAVVSKEAVYDAVYGNDPDGGPEPKILDVFICKIRKKLVGSGYTIVTHWGLGWRMTSVTGFDEAEETQVADDAAAVPADGG